MACSEPDLPIDAPSTEQEGGALAGEAPPSCRNERRRERKRLCLLFGFMGFIAFGIMDGLGFGKLSALVLLPAAPVTLGALVWVQLDAAERGKRAATMVQLLILMVGPLGIIVYLLSRRRFKSLLLAFLVFLCAVLAMGVASELTKYLQR